MRLHRFFSPEPITKDKFLVTDKELLGQWRKVLRFSEGDQVILFDNSGFEFLSEIRELGQKSAELFVLKKEKKDTKLPFNISLFQALIKKERFEWVLEKGTEFGASSFLPIITERSIKQNLNLKRAEKIIKEASEQSGKVKLPEVFPPQNLKETLTQNKENFLVALDPSGKPFLKKDLIAKNIGVFIGPEGGWSEDELKLFSGNNIPVYSLGSQILRSETAAISFCSIILLNS